MKADKGNVPAQKRQKQETPWTSGCDLKEKGDIHKWRYATAAFFGKTSFEDNVAPGPLLQEVNADHGFMKEFIYFLTWLRK